MTVDDEGNTQYYQYPAAGGEDDDLLDEFPDDLEEGNPDGEQFEDDELDSDGEPLPSEIEIRDIINSIPSFKFEEAQ